MTRNLKHVWIVEEAPALGAGSPKSFWTKIGMVPVTGKMVIRDATRSHSPRPQLRNAVSHDSEHDPEARVVRVDVQMQPGLPTLVIKGLATASERESTDRTFNAQFPREHPMRSR